MSEHLKMAQMTLTNAAEKTANILNNIRDIENLSDVYNDLADIFGDIWRAQTCVELAIKDHNTQ